jgi:hypothetical protein
MRLRTIGVAALLALPAASAFAITYGQADEGRHPWVGALVGQFSSGQFPYCSGTLISPTVFLTAAHCDLGTSRVTVTFDEVHTANAKLHAGTYYANPAYSQTQVDPQDIAVVVFDKPIRGITPARLPGAGLLEGVGKGQLFTAVGYGGQERNIGPGGPVIGYEDAREFSITSFSALGPGYLRLSQNQATGDGGTCYGDSGGPNFLGAGAAETTIIAGTTITGDAQCVSTNTTQRLDTAASRAFLGRFVPLP